MYATLLNEHLPLVYDVSVITNSLTNENKVDIKFLDENGKSFYKATYHQVYPETLYNLIKNGETIEFENSYIKGFSLTEYRKIMNMSTESLVQIGSVIFKKCFFDCEEDIDFTYSLFQGDVVFDSVIFANGEVEFYASNFGNSNVKYTNCRFGKGPVNFKSTRFGEGNISFQGSNFGNGDLIFADTDFGNGNVSFKSITLIKGNVDFKFAKFSEGGITFERAEFGEGKKDFKNVEFGGGRLDFRRVNFNNGDVLFEGVEFGTGKVNFRGSSFGEGSISFVLADFSHGEANFDNVEFGEGILSFNQANADRISFKECQFNSHVDLRFSKCNHIDLSNTVVRDIIDVQPIDEHVVIKEMNITNMRILGRMFINWRENNVHSLIYSQQDTSFFQKAEQFRILKENFRTNGQYEDEDLSYIEFKRCEARSELEDEIKSNSFAKYIAYPKYYFQKYVFDSVGRFGTAPSRVIMNALITVFIFGFIYYIATNFFPHIGAVESSLPDNIKHVNEFLTCMYYSAITFFTIGYGDYFPYGLLKVFSVLEGFTGVFLMSYFTVAFVRKILR